MSKQYDDQGRLTRTAAVQIIQGGGSVSVGGKIFASVDTLPSEADFARGSKSAEADAKKRIEATIADAQAQLKSLEAAPAEDHAAKKK